MRIYLGACCLQRPFDDQTQPRIRVETEAVFAVLATIQSGEQSLLNSEALEYEISRIPDEVRRNEVVEILALASERVLLTDEAQALAFSLERDGLHSMDAIHLALASATQADFFCTCDDQLFQKARTVPDLSCKVTTLLGLVPEVTK